MHFVQAVCRQCVVIRPYDARRLAGKEPRNVAIELHMDTDQWRSCGLCVECCMPAARAYNNWPKYPASFCSLLSQESPAVDAVRCSGRIITTMQEHIFNQQPPAANVD